jgi:hypothetical protein
MCEMSGRNIRSHSTFLLPNHSPLRIDANTAFIFPSFFFPLPFVFFGQQHGLSVQPLVLAPFNL